MDTNLAFFGTVFAAFFAIMNPFANTAVFLSVTEGMDEKTTRQLAWRSLALAFVITTVFSASGDILFRFFGITVYAFMIAGGTLVALVGYGLLQGKHSSLQKPADEHLKVDREAVLGLAVSPLAMPLLAGPGTLVTGMHFATGGERMQLALVIAAFFVVCVTTFFCFISGQAITRYLGKSVISVISRIMGLILAVIGTQMLIDGIRAAIAAGPGGSGG